MNGDVRDRSRPLPPFKGAIPVLHRADCPRCGCRTEFLKERCLICNARLSDSVKPDIRIKTRRRTPRKNTSEGIGSSAEGLGPLFEQGKGII